MFATEMDSEAYGLPRVPSNNSPGRKKPRLNARTARVRTGGPIAGVVLFGLAWLLNDSCVAAQRPASESGRIDARMMRQPDISANRIAFVYAGDIWVAPRRGGVATRLSSPRGEESFPKFSPDGSMIAFSGNYDGNLDIYVVPTAGGIPRRITHHGAPDRLVGWYPDGKHLLFATSMTSYKDRFNQLYRVSVEGGLPEKLPVPYGEFGTISPNGKSLAYTPVSVDFRTWKRYRGGMNPDIWIFDLEKFTARNLTESPAAESVPMWHGNRIYFLSDRDEHKRANLWVCDLQTSQFRQLTFFTDYDVHFPSIGPRDIVFECAGQLYLLDLRTEEYRPVSISVVTDRATLKPRMQNVSGHVGDSAISPSGKRVLFAARGEIFSAPAEHGVVRNLTRSPGVAERFPAWSPDGKLIAFFSDKTGEYELTVIPASSNVVDQAGSAEQTLTRLGPGFRYRPQWSPDSKKILWIDQTMRISVYDFDAKTNKVIDRQMWMYHGELASFGVSWSSDSRWIAYAADLENRNTCIVIYDYPAGRRYQITSGFYDDSEPVFDPDGKHLFFRTSREFSPVYSDLDTSWIYPNSTRLAAVPLRKDVPSPLAPRNDEETEKEKDKDNDKNKPEEKPSDNPKPDEKKDSPKPEPEKKDADDKGQKKSSDKEGKEGAAGAASAKTEDKKSEKKEEQKPTTVEIDIDGFESRLVLLPQKAGRYGSLCAVPGKLIYRVLPRTGSDGGPSPVEFYDIEKRETKRIVDDADQIQLSANREKLLVRKDRTYAIIEPKEGQKLDKKIATAGFEALVDPVAEWRQIFDDAWRFERDFFYDPGLHGVDWNQMRDRYLRLLADAVTRWDVNFVIGELIGELNSSHTYRGGGDIETAPQRGVGYLGCDFVLTNGAYRIARILEGAPWDAEVRSPLRCPGLTNISEGDYLLAVNGVPLDVTEDPWSAFQGLADKPVILTVNTNASMVGARDVLVHTLASEARLRNLAWINENRLKVDKLSDGKIGYVYVPDTGQNGQNELVRQWRGQIAKAGLIIDERFNSGGQIPDRFVELLDRPLRNFWGVRDGQDWAWPPVAHFGPKAMLMNGWSGSGGDCLPFYFKQSGLGPLVGLRTWGGLIGMTGAPELIDGGSVTVPTFGIYSTDSQWIIEGHGVDPDIEVVDDPAAMARGGDPQLERAVGEVMKLISERPPPVPRKPPYPKRGGA